MGDSEWDRPGIIPGLQSSSQHRRSSRGVVPSGVFGYIADPDDTKSPPGIGATCARLGSDSSSAQTQNCLEQVVEAPLSVPKISEPLPRMTGNLLIRGGRIMDAENPCRIDILVRDGKIGAIGEKLVNDNQAVEIDATNLVISPGMVDLSATSHAFNNRLNVEGMADEKLIREATSRAVLAGVTTIVDTVYSDDGQSPLSAVAAYLQALQTTYVHCNVAVRAGIRHMTVSTVSDIELLAKRHHIRSFLLAISENDRIMCEKGNPEGSVLYGTLLTCRGLGIVPTIGLDKLTGSHSPQGLDDPELRLASVAIVVAKLTGCPIILSPVRSLAVMNLIYTAQREYPPLFIYADFATRAFNTTSMKDQAPYIVADGNIIVSSGECYVLPDDLDSPEDSWILDAYHHIVKRGWASERHITGSSCKRPAQLAGLYPQKGCLSIGYDADLVLWPEDDRSKPVFTIVGGRVAVQYGQLKITTARDRENGNAIKAGFVRGGQTPCGILVAVHETIKEIGKSLGQTLPAAKKKLSDEDGIANKLESARVSSAGDTPPAGLPTREMRSIASKYKRDSLSSNFKLTGEQKDDDRPIRPNIRIWQDKHDSPRPY